VSRVFIGGIKFVKSWGIMSRAIRRNRRTGGDVSTADDGCGRGAETAGNLKDLNRLADRPVTEPLGAAARCYYPRWASANGSMTWSFVCSNCGVVIGWKETFEEGKVCSIKPDTSAGALRFPSSSPQDRKQCLWAAAGTAVGVGEGY
jgi:hypothetical protein